MYTCYLINFGFHLQGEFETVAEALAFARFKGFETSVIKRGEPTIYATYSPLYGVSIYQGLNRNGRIKERGICKLNGRLKENKNEKK